MRLFLAAAFIAAATSAYADTTSGTIAAISSEQNSLTLSDMSVWQFAPGKMPADIAVGDRITLDFTSAGENGVASVNNVTRF